VLTTTATGFRATARWRAGVRRAWSFAVYYVGFRLLAVHLTCGSWAVSGMPLVVKYAGT
jgi:hypothetical protein